MMRIMISINDFEGLIYYKLNVLISLKRGHFKQSLSYIRTIIFVNMNFVASATSCTCSTRAPGDPASMRSPATPSASAIDIKKKRLDKTSIDGKLGCTKRWKGFVSWRKTHLAAGQSHQLPVVAGVH